MSGSANPRRSRQRAHLGFLNFAHALDHFVILIYPTVIIELERTFHRSYSDLILLGAASFTAFGLFSLPAGWLADRWSRTKMMMIFYFGTGISLIAAAGARSLEALALALFAVGIFAAIYHPVGTALVVESRTNRSRTLAFNALCGNLGVAFASGVTAALIAAISWRGAFFVPGVICIAAGAAYCLFMPAETRRRTASAGPVSQDFARGATALITLFVLIALTGGLVVNTIILALPKIVNEGIGEPDLTGIGVLTSGIILFGALAQIIVGRLAEHMRTLVLFVAIACLQFLGILAASFLSGTLLLITLIITMAAIFGQMTVNDLVIAQCTPDAWRGRAYAVRYLVTFMVSGLSAAMIAFLHAGGGFHWVLDATAVAALGFLAAVVGLVMICRVPTARLPASSFAGR